MPTPFKIKDSRLIADFLLLMVALFWGMSYGLAKTATLFYPVLGFLAIRFCIASIIISPALLRLNRSQLTQTLTKGPPLGFILLIIFIAETYGLFYTTASNAAFLISLCIILTPFVEWLLLNTKPTPKIIAAAIISTIGALFLSVSGNFNFTFNRGDGFILFAALMRGFMVVCTRKLIQNTEIPSLALTAVQTGVVGLGCLLLGTALLPEGLPPIPWTGDFWVPTFLLIVLCTLFAFFAQNYALSKTTPTRVSLLMGTEPVFGALFAVIYLSERLSPIGWLGGLMMVFASIWAVLPEPRKNSR
ncbi:MAG: DMT family transporter [Comamonas sp.]